MCGFTACLSAAGVTAGYAKPLASVHRDMALLMEAFVYFSYISVR